MPTPKELCKFIILCVGIHVLLLSAAFDIYFSSPVQHGMKPHKAEGAAVARRVVLFVADGLRAESLYNSRMEVNTPYLYSVKTTHSTWGISHTQVPTESRPGHIAMLAGFNEDPSAITRGWQSNPVDFDSVINQSTNSWCWGSPDIVNMFNKENLPFIHLHSYDPYMQDFSGKSSPVLLDQWVFDKVDNFFKTRERDCTDVCDSGNIFFLHLLGLDTAGHSIKPTSEKYIENLVAVDKGIKATVNIVEKYFGDAQTTYIFTSDHGMTDWGSHGAGSNFETEVPIIAWGSGISHHKTKIDIQQTDIAPLISSILGINIPVNSLGVVPLSFFDIPDYLKVQVISANVRQISEQYLIKHRDSKQNTIPFVFRPYPAIPTEDAIQEKLLNLNTILRGYQDSKPAIAEGYRLIKLFNDGLKYYYNYYQNFLLFFIASGFIGWITYLFSSITDVNTFTYRDIRWSIQRRSFITTEIFFAVGIIVAAMLTPFIYHLPERYFIYCFFPIFIWLMVIRNHKDLIINVKVLGSYDPKELLLKVKYFAGIWILIATFFHPPILFAVFTYYGLRELYVQGLNIESYIWGISQIILGSSPVVLQDLQMEFKYVVQIISLILWFIYSYSLYARGTFSKDGRVFFAQYVILTLAFVNTLFVHFTIVHGQGLLLINQLISWAILLVSPIFPTLIAGKLENKVVSSILALTTIYSLMGVGYENIFIFFFIQHLLNWMVVEHRAVIKKHATDPDIENYLPVMYRPGYTDEKTVERCFTLLSYVMLGYFGVGNSANINSFDPMWVRCFVTVFSPFTMMGLIFIKLTIPFLMVMVVFRGIAIITRAQIHNTFLIILLFCDVMVLLFLFMIKNEGSWLEIGVSLCRFVCSIATTVVLLILYQVAVIMTTADLRETAIGVFFKRRLRIYTLDVF